MIPAQRGGKYITYTHSLAAIRYARRQAVALRFAVDTHTQIDRDRITENNCCVAAQLNQPIFTFIHQKAGRNKEQT